MPSAPSIEEGSRRAQRSRSCIAIGSREGFQWSSSSRNSAQPSHPFYGGGHLDSTERRARTTLAATSRRAQIGMSGVSYTERFRRRGLGVRGVGLEARLKQPSSSVNTGNAFQCERDGAVAGGLRQAESEGAFHCGQERSGGHVEVVLVHIGLDALDQESADERIEFRFEFRSCG